jgi:K+-transporting ATPase ATPase C chain
VVGAANVGQPFVSDRYFWGRPSIAGDGYDATRSGGSNMGPTNPEYLSEVEQRIDNFLAKHPYLTRDEVPAEMVTASGSGLDPDISPERARVQVRRVAEARHLGVDEVSDLVERSIKQPLLGLFGTPRINVLQLNIALDELSSERSEQ